KHPPTTTVLDVTFTGDELSPYSSSISQEATSLGVTDNHLFWSVDRASFAPIGEMAIGERVLTYHGETKRIAQKLPRPGPQLVYNLEVYGEHVYFVGEEALLVHNSYAPRRTGTLADLGEGPEARAVRLRSDFEVGATRGSVIEEHHVFPREMEQLFAKRGIDVHNFVIDLEVPLYKAIHGGGDWRLARKTWEGEWNAQMLRELKQTTRAAGRRLTPDEIVSIGENLMSRYGLSGSFHRYSRAPKKVNP
ncbi:MAG: DUF2380 domain-containing protein, partial [Planctomycetales bacterium]|nr:DUF2380 domain-containing protein [Planctomycetales bacterium]